MSCTFKGKGCRRRKSRSSVLGSEAEKKLQQMGSVDPDPPNHGGVVPDTSVFIQPPQMRMYKEAGWLPEHIPLLVFLT